MNDGRLSGKMASILTKRITEGRYAPGRFLPSLRQLALEHGVSYVTAVRAMKILEREGIVASEKRRGYRALSLANDPLRGCPVAMIAGMDLMDPSRWNSVHHSLLVGLQEAAMTKGWSMLGITQAKQNPSDIVNQLRTARVVGVAVDSWSLALVEAIQEAGIPLVLIDAWDEKLKADGVVQDNFAGTFTASRWLIERGCQKIAWAGRPVDHSAHSRERLGGAAAALQTAGQSLTRASIVEIPEYTDPTPALRSLLSRRNRPDGVVAPWEDVALGVKQVADELGLVMGRDLHLVGWTLEETYASQYASHFSEAEPAAAMVWSARTMATTALRRLMDRRAHPDLPPLRLSVPTRLRTGGNESRNIA